MKNGIAMWHYGHRTVLQNIDFFASHGLDTLSLHQNHVLECIRGGLGGELARIILHHGITLTVHGLLVKSHEPADVDDFKARMELIGEWQKKHGLIAIISFDVPDEVRDNVTEYIRFVLDTVEGCRVALEDFGLNERERAEIECFKGNERFGYLVDVGHMFIRLCGKSESPLTLFHNSSDECPASEMPGYSEFKRAFASKAFPIFEIHLHNNDGANDLHWFLENGRLDMGVIGRLLKDINYSGIVTVESAPGYLFECYGEDADNGIFRTLSFWESILDGIEL